MMRDNIGKGRWIVGSIVGVVALVLLLSLVRGAGTSAQEQPTPVRAPTPAATATPPATQVRVAADQELQVQKVFSDLHDLASGIPPYDARQLQLVERYQQAKNLALRTGVPIQFIEESKRFSREQAFLSAKAAWEDALWHGQVTRADKQGVTYYATLLRNGGRNFAARGATDDLRAIGLSLLVACMQITEKLEVPLGECHADVREFLGDKPLPLPAPSPLL